jgi:hypothetical protein
MKTKNKIILDTAVITFLIMVAMLLTGIMGCNKADNPMQSSNSSGNLSLSSISDNNTTGNNPQNILVIHEAKVMIKDMKIEMEEGNGGEGEDEDFKIGPFVIDLNLDAKVNLITTSVLKAGNYEKVKFKIHKLSQNEVPPDPDFSDANGTYSVIVKGSYNGMDFIYKSKVTANQKLNLQKVLQITANRADNITFYASPILWFFDDNGNILDPTLEFNRHIIDDNIRDNIKNHIRIFVDDDHDGRPDS